MIFKSKCGDYGIYLKSDPISGNKYVIVDQGGNTYGYEFNAETEAKKCARHQMKIEEKKRNKSLIT